MEKYFITIPFINYYFFISYTDVTSHKAFVLNSSSVIDVQAVVNKLNELQYRVYIMSMANQQCHTISKTKLTSTEKWNIFS